MGLWIVLGVVVLGAIFVIAIYNGLVTMRNQVKNGWTQIDVQLKRRYDLIPNLLETVKGYMKHEQQVLENVTKFRSQAMGAHSAGERIEAENQLSRALANVMAVAENYPELKANQNFLALQEELTSTENRIGFSRQHYNDTVMQYNNKRQVFPNVIIAGMFNFGEEPYWQITDAAERAAPKVSFA
ncbi:MAG: Protein LemA [Myxococcota bacterium]|nr:Protein LemA [Myxococcota bacterium]